MVAASPTRRCYIHAGLPKTGTSYLQSVFWNSRESLRAQGVELLPQARGGHLNLALQLRGLIGPYDGPHVAGTLDRLTAQLARSGASTVLITQEALAPTTPEQAVPLLELLDGWEVHVVLTARDIARQVPSAWQQRIQARLTDRAAEFYAAVTDRLPLAGDFWANHDLPVVAANWAAGVGADRVHVVTCPPAGAESDVLLDRFCSVLGVDRAGLDTDQPTGNVSLGQAQAELQRRVNVALGDRFPHSRAGYLRLGQDYLAGKVLQRQPGRPARLPASMRRWADEIAADWAERLTSGGYSVVGDLADLRPGDGSFDPESRVVDDAELVEVAATAIADILEIRDRELDERAEVRRRLEEAERRLAERSTRRTLRGLAGSARRWLGRVKARRVRPEGGH